jgi:hypothetical protein
VSLHEPWMGVLARWRQPRLEAGQVGGHKPTSVPISFLSQILKPDLGPGRCQPGWRSRGAKPIWTTKGR